MSLTYTSWVATISNLTVIDSTDANFVQILPECIDYAEQRLSRELDLLNTVSRQTGALTVGTRSFTLPSAGGRYVVTSEMNVVVGTSLVPLLPVSLPTLNMLWPDSISHSGIPQVYAMVTDQTALVGPTPDQAYSVGVVGTIRPDPLSVSNSSTYLTLYLPDLFVAASMIFMTAYQKNWGAQSDDPQQAQSWEAQYNKLFASANVEEQRKRYASGAWGSLQPTPIATPNR